MNCYLLQDAIIYGFKIDDELSVALRIWDKPFIAKFYEITWFELLSIDGKGKCMLAAGTNLGESDKKKLTDYGVWNELLR